ncbi:MAG: hypothetical protein ACRDT6_24135 [Micromonosporaceae bacterium]
MSSRVLGVDACKAGWVGVVLHDGAATVHVATAAAELARSWSGAALADRVHAAARSADADADLDALLAAAAGRLTVTA